MTLKYKGGNMADSPTLDSMVGELQGGPAGEALQQYHDFMSEDRLRALSKNCFIPGADEFYKTFVAQLKEQSVDDEKHTVKDKEAEVKTALTHALKSYFGKVSPAFLEHLENIDESEHYDALVKHFEDTHFDRDTRRGINLDALILKQNQKAKVGEVIEYMGKMKGDFGKYGMDHLSQKVHSKFLGAYRSQDIAAALHEKAEGQGMTLEDPSQLYTKDTNDLMGLSTYLHTGKGRMDHEHYGLAQPGK